MIRDSRGTRPRQGGLEAVGFAAHAELALPRASLWRPSPGSRRRERSPPAQPSLRRPRLALSAAAARKLQPRRAPAVHSSRLGLGGWDTAGAPRGSASWGGKEPSEEDYEESNSQRCYRLRIWRSCYLGHKSFCPQGYGAPERSQTAGVQCQRPSLDLCIEQRIV